VNENIYPPIGIEAVAYFCTNVVMLLFLELKNEAPRNKLAEHFVRK